MNPDDIDLEDIVAWTPPAPQEPSRSYAQVKRWGDEILPTPPRTETYARPPGSPSWKQVTQIHYAPQGAVRHGNP